MANNLLGPLVVFEAQIQKVLPLPPGPATILSQMQMPSIRGLQGTGQPTAGGQPPCPGGT